MIIELDNYLSVDTVEHIKQQIQPHINTHGEVNDYHRAGTTVSINRVEELAAVTGELSNIFRNIKLLVREHFKPSYSGMSDSGYEYHLYQPGDVCKLHSDSEIVAGVNELRYATVILHLNTVDEGGELVFPAQERTVKTKIGKVVIFPPYGMFSHYTTPSTQERSIIMSWLTYDGVGVGKKGINITSNQGL
jgi:predicted 2-oxoglutarate/Fe(II)-dependent dioxygenase YbiX